MRKFKGRKHAKFICDRSGFEYPLSEAVLEPGTNFMVHYSESDGNYSRVKHPQNFPPKNVVDEIGLQYARPGRVEESIGYLLIGGFYLTDEQGGRIRTP